LSPSAIAIAPDSLTLTWVAVGSIVFELLVLIVFLVRVSWWLSQRFTLIEANFAQVGKELTRLETEIGNDIAGRRAVAESRNDIAELKVGLKNTSERLARLEENEDERRKAKSAV
jgi:hypothetical protein